MIRSRYPEWDLGRKFIDWERIWDYCSSGRTISKWRSMSTSVRSYILGSTIMALIWHWEADFSRFTKVERIWEWWYSVISRFYKQFCPSCGIAPETPTHFFLECSKYDDARRTLISNLSKLDPSLAIDDKNAIIDFIVLGSTQGDKATRTSVNKAIFRHAKIFISSTRRFIIWFALAVFTILICLMISSN